MFPSSSESTILLYSSLLHLWSALSHVSFCSLCLSMCKISSCLADLSAKDFSRLGLKSPENLLTTSSTEILGCRSRMGIKIEAEASFICKKSMHNITDTFLKLEQTIQIFQQFPSHTNVSFYCSLIQYVYTCIINTCSNDVFLKRLIFSHLQMFEDLTVAGIWHLFT